MPLLTSVKHMLNSLELLAFIPCSWGKKARQVSGLFGSWLCRVLSYTAGTIKHQVHNRLHWLGAARSTLLPLKCSAFFYPDSCRLLKKTLIPSLQHSVVTGHLPLPMLLPTPQKQRTCLFLALSSVWLLRATQLMFH